MNPERRVGVLVPMDEPDVGAFRREELAEHSGDMSRVPTVIARGERRLFSGRSSIGAALAAVTLGALATPAPSSAQDISPAATDRCVRAAVRIVALGQNGEPVSTGSGGVIDARGYVLTNFHVVGHVSPEHGVPGTLIDPRNRYPIALVTSSRENAEPRYLAEVVRGDAQLDLALLRIVSDARGQPLPRGQRFAHVELHATSGIRPGSRVYAFGYPLGVRTINVTGGQVTGFQLNARDQVAWLRTDAEFNPGNSGGMLVDAECRLVAVPTAVVHGQRTLEPIELARPAERVPAAWREALRRGAVEDLVITGVPTLGADATIRDAFQGDVGGLSANEIHYYLVPDALRPIRVRANVADLPLAVADRAGRILREGRGAIEVGPGDPPGLMLAALVEGASDRAVDVELRVERGPVQQPMVASSGPSMTNVPSVTRVPSVTSVPSPAPSGANPFAGPSQPYASVPPSATVVAPPGTTVVPPPRVAGQATIRGSIVEASTGRGVPGAMLLVGRPGVDMLRHVSDYVARRISEEQFFALLVGYGRTDANGRYEVAGLVPSTAYPAASFAQGYQPVNLRISVGVEGSVIELNPIPIRR